MLPTATTALLATGALSGLIAAAVPSADPGIAPYVGGGAGVVAVMTLAEVTRRLLNGRLIPREIKEWEQEMAAAIIAAGQREDRAMKVVEDANSLVTKTAAELKSATAKLAFDVAEVTQRQVTLMADQMASLQRAVHDLRDEVRDSRRTRGGDHRDDQ